MPSRKNPSEQKEGKHAFTGRADRDGKRRLCAFPRCERGAWLPGGGRRGRAKIYAQRAGVWGGKYCSHSCQAADARRRKGAKQKDTPAACRHCGGKMVDKQTARQRLYCSGRCRVAAHRGQDPGAPPQTPSARKSAAKRKAAGE